MVQPRSVFPPVEKPWNEVASGGVHLIKNHSVRHLIRRRRWSDHIVNLHLIHIRIYIVLI